MQCLLWWKSPWPIKNIFLKIKPYIQLNKICRTFDNCTIWWLARDFICHSFTNPSKRKELPSLTLSVYIEQMAKGHLCYCVSCTSDVTLNMLRKRSLKNLVRKELRTNTRKWPNTFNYYWNFFVNKRFSLVMHELLSLNQ